MSFTTIRRRLCVLEAQNYRFPFCDVLLQIFTGLGAEAAYRFISERGNLQGFLVVIAEDNIHDLEKFRGLVPDEVIRDAYRSQINRFGNPELQRLIRARAGL